MVGLSWNPVKLYLILTFWGLTGAIINATGRLYTALCEGESAPTRRKIQGAWMQFATALVTGGGLAASLTPLLATAAHAPAPPIAITVGLCGNGIAIALRDNVGGRIAAIVEALFGPVQPPKADP